jgi:hypothetical protein
MVSARCLQSNTGFTLMQVHSYVHPVVFCGVGANAAAAALAAVQQQPHADVLRAYMSEVHRGSTIRATTAACP